MVMKTTLEQNTGSNASVINIFKSSVSDDLEKIFF